MHPHPPIPPKCRPIQPKQPVSSIFHPMGLQFGGHTPRLVAPQPPNGGMTPSKAPTRRRHAVRGLRMAQNPHRHRCVGRRRDQRTRPRRRRAAEGLAAAPVGGGRAWPGIETTHQATHQQHKHRRCGGCRRVRRARAGFEIDHSEPLGSRVAISRAAGPDGARNTSGATSNNTQHVRLAGGPPPTGASSSPASQSGL